jgi:hypothetical protein
MVNKIVAYNICIFDQNPESLVALKQMREKQKKT